MDVIRKLLSAAEIYPTNQRYNETTDMIEYSSDGGTTWTEAPALDPRHNGGLPSVATSDSRCDNAATIIAMLQALENPMIAGVGSGFTATVLTSGFIALLVFLGVFGFFVLIVVALVAAALGAGHEALVTAFSEEMWDTLLCIFYDRLEDDGRLTADGLVLVRADVNEQIGGIAAVILNYTFDAIGEIGLSDARLLVGVQAGDCAACIDTYCYYTNFAAEQDPDWEKLSVAGSYNSGVGWVGTSGGSTCDPAAEEIKIGYSLPSEATITFIYFGVSGVDGGHYWLPLDGEPLQDGDANGSISVTWEGNVTGQDVAMRLGGTTQAIIADATISGVGAAFDFGQYNCE